MSNAPASDLLTVPEVARHLGLHTQTVYRLLSSGNLKGVRIGRVWRVRRQSVEAFRRTRESSRYQA
ncbi:MAG: helix-turn-helix domain-containing protein [Dehalococcoidales bacterium]|nr:helix-turn-helix domain-containing protein [Dehalococcoidales bacterium]